MTELMQCLAAACRAADALIVGGDARFVPMLKNLKAMTSQRKNEQLALLANAHGSDHLPFFMDKGGSWTEELTPAMKVLVEALGEVRRAAVAASPQLQALYEERNNPIAQSLAHGGHSLLLLKSGALIFDDGWEMPSVGPGAARVSSAAPLPYLLGQTALSLWIVDLRARRWARLDVASGLAEGFSFLGTLAATDELVRYDLPVLKKTWPAVQIEICRKEIRYRHMGWRSCVQKTMP